MVPNRSKTVPSTSIPILENRASSHLSEVRDIEGRPQELEFKKSYLGQRARTTNKIGVGGGGGLPVHFDDSIKNKEGQ